MSKNINVKYDATISDDMIQSADDALKKLKSGKVDMTDWMDYPFQMEQGLIQKIKDLAEKINEKYSTLVVVGIGGSYTGAKAALDFTGYDENKTKTKIVFSGINISSDHHKRILQQLDGEDVALCIISKSGTTTETLISGNIFLDYLEKRYGKDKMTDRVVLITDEKNGLLRKMADEKGYSSLPIPAGIGGRYSVLSSVGFFPMAVAGIDIEQVIEGAKSILDDHNIKAAKELAVLRNNYEEKGYSVELFACFEPSLNYQIEWIKQLLGESEGKEGRGMLPMNLDFTRDLHSLGQFIQQGRQIFTETIIDFKNKKKGIQIPKEWGVADKDMDMNDINAAAKYGVINAHKSAGVPIIQIEVDDNSSYCFGQIIYFFQIVCAIKGIIMNVDPFDQPGVEAYKSEMRKYLKIQQV